MIETNVTNPDYPIFLKLSIQMNHN